MKICSLITLFNPDVEKLTKNLNQILQYVDKVYLLVNSKEKLEQKFNIDLDKIEFIYNNKNLGLSKAFNIGLKKASSELFELALLFDQDSFLDIENFNILLNQYNEIGKERNLICIGPLLTVYGKNLPIPKWNKNNTMPLPDDNAISVNSIITSGMLLDIEKAIAVGGFNEDYPVDFCDFVFCWKSIFNGYEVYMSTKARIIHEIGNSNMSIGKHTIHFHAPYRHYFMVRDTLNIVFKLKETPLKIRIRYLLLLPFREVLFFLKLDQKKERLSMYHKGFCDYVHNVHGYGSIAHLLGAE